MPKKESHSDPNKYTDPELRDKIKHEIMESDKGGKPGQWSARKAQLVAAEYEHQGGGFKGGKDESQQSLTKWGEEDWHTADGGKAVREEGTARYLPDEAWKKLSPKEKAETDKKKLEGSKKGKQFVANTEAAKEAGAEVRKAPAKKSAAKKAPAKSAAKAPGKKTSVKETPKKAAARSGSSAKQE